MNCNDVEILKKTSELRILDNASFKKKAPRGHDGRQLGPAEDFGRRYRTQKTIKNADAEKQAAMRKLSSQGGEFGSIPDTYHRWYGRQLERCFEK